MTLVAIGWAEPFQSSFQALEDDTLIPARVASAQRGQYTLWCEHGSVPAHVSGRLHHQADPGQLPVVGDWVAARLDARRERAVIEALLPRRGALVRKRPGTDHHPQVLVANVDIVFLLSSLNHDWNPRRVERALALTWESGAIPVLVLSKLDLCDDPSTQLAAAARLARGVPVHALSVYSGEGCAALAAYLSAGKTAALLGSSGVGKSTLANHLLGSEQLEVGEIRAGDDRGRHTTTQRELFTLPSGGLLIDTPGLRELGLWKTEEGLQTTFDEIVALARGCRFGDCSHSGEPGCGVVQALEHGVLDPARYHAYAKLKREEAHHARQADPRLMRSYRNMLKQRGSKKPRFEQE
jgi:ribosome biogenesis GTPase